MDGRAESTPRRGRLNGASHPSGLAALELRSEPKWRNGRRGGLKNLLGQPSVGSNPTFGTSDPGVKRSRFDRSEKPLVGKSSSGVDGGRADETALPAGDVTLLGRVEGGALAAFACHRTLAGPTSVPQTGEPWSILTGPLAWSRTTGLFGHSTSRSDVSEPLTATRRCPDGVPLTRPVAPPCWWRCCCPSDVGSTAPSGGRVADGSVPSEAGCLDIRNQQRRGAHAVASGNP